MSNGPQMNTDVTDDHRFFFVFCLCNRCGLVALTASKQDARTHGETGNQGGQDGADGVDDGTPLVGSQFAHDIIFDNV